MKPLKAIISSLPAKKSLGQNFLLDPHILKRIVQSAAPFEERTLIEVGAGPGGLSRELLKTSAKTIFLIERDSRYIPSLNLLKDFREGSLLVEHADAMTLPLHTYGNKPRKIIANLPYNISVPLVLQWLYHMTCFESLTLMFQKEVAERLLAPPHTSSYGRLSVMCQTYANVEKLFDLPPGAFTPPPKVSSTILRLTPKEIPPSISWDSLELITKTAFSQRRKMLRSSLKSLFKVQTLEKLGIPPTHRAENLSPHHFCTLARLWEDLEKI